MLPSDGAVITVGQTIFCSAQGNPPPSLVLSLKRSGVWKEEKRGTEQVAFVLPMEEEAGEVEAMCKAKNSDGEKTKKQKYTVKSKCRETVAWFI